MPSTDMGKWLNHPPSLDSLGGGERGYSFEASISLSLSVSIFGPIIC